MALLNGKSPHATKRGPGRRHFQGASQRRFPVAAHGGNWQGQPYISYREHDHLTRVRLATVDNAPARRIDDSIDEYLG